MPIYDQRDVLLLAEGRVISDHFFERLKSRRIRNVRVDRTVAARLAAGRAQGTGTTAAENRPGHVSSHRNDASDELDAAARRGLTHLPKQGQALLDELPRLGEVGFDPAQVAACLDGCVESVSRVEDVYGDLAAGQRLRSEDLGDVADQTFAHLVGDPDMFVSLAANPFGEDQPARHSVHTAMLALAVGTQLRLDKPTLKELVLGCMLHDAGMLRVDPEIVASPGRIDPVTFLEVTKHPIYVFDLLKDLGTISPRTAFIAYQMHERCDGSGYPRRREAVQIHFLSKVAAVADVYMALVSQRPHRQAMLPYKAMEKILQDTRRGLFDAQATRALLQTLSLFPLGSYVELTDGRQGRVIRATETYHRPIVELAVPGRRRRSSTCRRRRTSPSPGRCRA